MGIAPESTDRAFAIELVLDPAPEDRATLRDWSGGSFHPDYLVVTAGWIRLSFGGVPVAYRGGLFVRLRPGEPLPAGASDRLPEYVGGFAERLADGLAELGPGESCFVAMIEGPAGLRLAVAGARASIAWREGAGECDLLRAELALSELRLTCRGALERFLGSLIALNPALAGQPDVARLRRKIARLGARDTCRG
jgi:hypothetical protein